MERKLVIFSYNADGIRVPKHEIPLDDKDRCYIVTEHDVEGMQQ